MRGPESDMCLNNGYYEVISCGDLVSYVVYTFVRLLKYNCYSISGGDFKKIVNKSLLTCKQGIFMPGAALL